MKIIVPEEYPWVLLIIAVLGIVGWSLFLFVGVGNRGKIFNKEYMSQYSKAHKEAFGSDLAEGTFGYPDMGNGRYSIDLDYGEWYSFNNWQRVHYNYLE